MCHNAKPNCATPHDAAYARYRGRLAPCAEVLARDLDGRQSALETNRRLEMPSSGTQSCVLQKFRNLIPFHKEGTPQWQASHR